MFVGVNENWRALQDQLYRAQVPSVPEDNFIIGLYLTICNETQIKIHMMLPPLTSLSEGQTPPGHHQYGLPPHPN